MTAYGLPIPAAGNLDNYIQTVNSFPILTQERETALARRIRSRATPVEEPALVEAATPLTARSLPDYLTSMVGREGEIGAGVHLLANPDVRLVTVTGPGGIGKSRLAVEIGRRSAAGYPDGVHFVPLVALTDSGRVLGEIAATLGVEAREGMLLEAVAERLSGRRALLVLDNFEHLLEAAAGWASSSSGFPAWTRWSRAARL